LSRHILESLGIKYRCPILDSKTRWNSTLQMIERAIEISPAMDKIVNEIPELNIFSLLPREWNMLEEILLPLKVFRDISEALRGESYMTMPFAIPAFNLIMDDLQE
ncbi:10397_t:CDS:1, partial [Ambispora leptoticha]